jgi:hypothetical protein
MTFDAREKMSWTTMMVGTETLPALMAFSLVDEKRTAAHCVQYQAFGAMASQTALRRLWRNIPLHRLTQGSSLTIHSKLRQPTHVVFVPSWRDDGNVDFQQIFSKERNEPHVEMVVNQEQDAQTSLGRLASHVSLELRHTNLSSSNHQHTSSQHADSFMDTIPQSPSKPIDRVILDDGTIAPVENFTELPAGTSRVDYHDGIAHLHNDCRDEDETAPSTAAAAAAAAAKQPGTYITIQMPEKVNLVCDIQHGSITVTDKVEGDVKFCTADGDIRVKKLRGHVIELQNDGLNNLIYASHLLESQTLTVQTKGRFRAKQIHGSTVDVMVDRQSSSYNNNDTDDDVCERIMDEEDDEGSLVDVSSMFVSGTGGATVTVRGGGSQTPALQLRAVRIKSHHGPLKVVTNGVPVPPTCINPMTQQVFPVVELGGVNGSCEVSIENSGGGSVDTNDIDGSWSSCLVHVDSLSQDSVSLVTADRGNISITLDRKAETDLRLVSLSDAECLTETGSLLAEEEGTELLVRVLRHLPALPNREPKDDESISIQTDAFTLRPETSFRSNDTVYVDGWVENKSDEPDSRFERKERGDGGSGGGGDSVGKIRLDGAKDQALYGFSAEGSSTKDGSGYQRPLLAVAGTRRVTVETVSWLGAIARRYGLQEAGRELGRTASRRGRPLVPNE